MIPQLANHLWQSTLFAAAAGLLAIAFRRNRASVRYWLWFAASLKFFLPFAVLEDAGHRFEWTPATRKVAEAIAAPAVSYSVEQFATPLSATRPPARPAPASHHRLPIALLGLWSCGFLAVALLRFRDWLRIRAAVRASIPTGIPAAVEIRSSPGLLEPGVVGFLRPILLLPEGIAGRLTPTQLDAVLAHELCHVRRRDNLFASIHMLTEAAFWFHPLVWWIGAKMIDERERACDEAVLLHGSEPREYAEAIVGVCKLYLESPLACVSGVTGSDIKKRIRAIMTEPVASSLSVTRKLALVAAGFAALAAPVIIGVLNAPVIQAQTAPANTPKFEVASVRACPDPSQQPPPPGGIHIPGSNSSPGRLATDCVPLRQLIGNTYTTEADGMMPLTGGPSWIYTSSYEINARAAGSPSYRTMKGPMLQALLEDRFQLKIHRETKEGPVYYLSVARGGPKLSPFKEGSCTPWPSPPPLQMTKEYCNRTIYGLESRIEAQALTIEDFSKLLRPVLGRPVIDKTGIAGRFDFNFKFSREGTELETIKPAGGPPTASDPGSPASVFTALQEDFGLRLESGKGPVDTLVIDSIEKPSEN